MNKYIRKSLKVILWIIASIILLVVLLVISLNIPAVQNFVKDQAISYLKNKTKTEVSLESIHIAFPKDIVMNKFYMEDRKGDTLLYAQKLAVDVDLFKIFSNKIEVNNISLEKIRANVTRIDPDTTFNFSFLVDAFMSDQTKPEDQVKKDTTSTLKFSINKISLEDIGINYRDDVAGNEVKLNLGEFKTNIKDFDMDHQRYVIQSLSLKNTDLKYAQRKPLTQLKAHLEQSIDTAKTASGKLPYVEIKDFAFNQVKINFDDQLSQMSADVNLNELALTQLVADLTNNKYNVAEGKINNSTVDYQAAATQMKAKVNLKEFSLSKLMADLTKSNYQLEQATLNNSEVLFAFKPAAATKASASSKSSSATKSGTPAKGTAATDPSASAPISLLLSKLNLSKNNIQYDNLSAKPTKGMDFNHLKIKDLDVIAEGVAYGPDGIKVKVKKGFMKEKSGFQLSRLQGDVAYTDQAVYVKNFILKTPNTSIENATSLTYTSMDDLTKHPERVKINMVVKNSTIGLKDAGYFSDAVPAAYRNEKLKINGSANGYLNDLNIPGFQASGLKSTNINLNGKIKGLPDLNKLYLDLNIKQFSLTKQDLLVVIPKNTLPTNIELPNKIQAFGKFTGSLTNFNTGFNINTDMGSAKLLANMKGPKGKEQYTANVNLNNFNVGKLLKQQAQLGKITAKATINGTGLDPKTASLKINGQIINATYNKYTYKNLDINGTYAQQKLNLKSNMADSNLNFKLSAAVNIAGKYPAVKAKMDLTQVDLKALNFSPTEFKVAGIVDADLSTADVDYLNGDIFIKGLQVVKEGKKINVDTIQIHAETNAEKSLLTLKSELMTARIDGKYQLSNLATAVTNQINKYYQFGEVKQIPDQRIRFFAKVYNPKFIQDFVPSLTTFSPSYIYGLLDTKKDSLAMKAWVPHVVYGDYKVDSTRLSIDNTDQKINYKLMVKSLQSSSINLYNTEISGDAVDNHLGVNIYLRDRKLKDKYLLGGTFQSINKDYRFSLDPQKLLLNYQKWVVAPENYIQFGQSGIMAKNFDISRDNQLLSVNSVGNEANAPLKVLFKDFKIETLTKFAEQDSSLIGGSINGTVDAKDLMGTPKFEANLTIDQLRYQKDQLGTLRVAVNNNTENAFETNISLSGVHELRVNGFYYTAPESALDLTLNVDKIDLKSLESVSMGQIKRGSGTISGEMKVKGALTAPKINGELKFNQAAFTATYVNSYFRMPNETITFNEEGIRFDNFTVLDSLNQALKVNGKILTSNYRDFRFGLDISAKNFRLMNSTSADNDMIYGKVFVSTNFFKIRGDMYQPQINMNLTVNKGTKFFFAMPSADPTIIDQEGVVQFIDMNAPPFNGQKVLIAASDSLNKAPIMGINLSADLNMDKDAEFTVVVDPSNGDQLKVKGEGTLNATMDPSGKMSLTGRYELSDGSYKLSVGGIATREFKIQQGSSIVWTGEPTSANVDITAIYEVNAPAIDLVANELGDDAYLRAQAKQKFPFQVYLMITGEIMKPIINFRLDLPENERGILGGQVYTKIQNVNTNESELNKQVFALLALERFIADNPFQSLAGSGNGLVANYARQSVSKLLTDQLNNLASDLIKGVDINFGLNTSEDYSTGKLENRTELEIGLSKKLLDDRLTVTVGSSFGLEGNSNQNNNNSSNIAGNVNIEYLLSKDGRYRLRAYRRNQTDGIIEGQIVETGIGFALVVDYNRFREIFKQFKDRRTFKKEQKPKNEKTN
ncbi:translocation/assembly module TamB domain-containing protein [Pedobacter gandavensis]|uniref:Translocation/assembly module TamB n=1 Tax=Pedobacter gandavensis TaxID=2679963 RepID=A0ABR6F3C7_9SPHI|nr:translocation/assembly module TamB domain-containing protein [Pedobacter gandavensis]MBB2151752.1 translocation/assembly module TamB [Pedobacter gandavensis]